MHVPRYGRGFDLRRAAASSPVKYIPWHVFDAKNSSWRILVVITAVLAARLIQTTSPHCSVRSKNLPPTSTSTMKSSDFGGDPSTGVITHETRRSARFQHPQRNSPPSTILTPEEPTIEAALVLHVPGKM